MLEWLSTHVKAGFIDVQQQGICNVFFFTLFIFFVFPQQNKSVNLVVYFYLSGLCVFFK